mmetsp:Transcript_27069/g.49167  ORF Transcript_27069/g.49167 Transcript_27069/m.49167 type:complete len:84 (+) Transcript_27069:125-376(+)
MPIHFIMLHTLKIAMRRIRPTIARAEAALEVTSCWNTKLTTRMPIFSEWPNLSMAWCVQYCTGNLGVPTDFAIIKSDQEEKYF